jgi:hypothetical protein
MWEFDVNGEMYHEKAINFLGELFANWKVGNIDIILLRKRTLLCHNFTHKRINRALTT